MSDFDIFLRNQNSLNELSESTLILTPFHSPIYHFLSSPPIYFIVSFHVSHRYSFIKILVCSSTLSIPPQTEYFILDPLRINCRYFYFTIKNNNKLVESGAWLFQIKDKARNCPRASTTSKTHERNWMIDIAMGL